MTAHIGFAFDFTNAASLLAFKPTCALADELGVNVDWLPFPTESRGVPAQKPDETVSDRHARVRAEYYARDAARYARGQGIEMSRDGAEVDSKLACSGCLVANRHGVGRAYTERVLFDFWANRLDIKDGEAIASVLATLGVDGFDAESGASELAAHQKALGERGVFNIPTYLVADQLFVGRQHLPMIRWLLTGEQGPGPL